MTANNTLLASLNVSFTNFLANNYVWFLIISLILIFALIGYLVDSKEIKSGKKIKKQKEELKVVDFSTIDQSKSLSQSIKEENKSDLNLDEYVNSNTEKNEINDNTDNENSELTSINLDEDLEIPDLEEHQKQENEFKENVNE